MKIIVSILFDVDLMSFVTIAVSLSLCLSYVMLRLLSAKMQALTFAKSFARASNIRKEKHSEKTFIIDIKNCFDSFVLKFKKKNEIIQ